MSPGKSDRSRRILASLLVACGLAAGEAVPTAGESANRQAQDDRQTIQDDRQPITESVERDVETLATLWSGGRYRITPGDVLQLTFVYVPEFDQTLTVQPDGYITLRGIGDLRALGLTVPDLRLALAAAYAPLLKEPTITVVLKEFEKPYFIAAGEVSHPGKYELRGATTLSQALAVAGGPTPGSKRSEVVLLRRHDDQVAMVTHVNIGKMYKSKDLTEDPLVRAGDTLFVPRSSWSSISPFIPRPGIIFSPFIQ